MLPITSHFKGAGKSIRVDRFDPVGKPNGGAIIIAHGSDGIVDNHNGPWETMMKGYANDLAGKGFVALLPHYFGSSRAVDPLKLPLYQTVLADAVTFAKTLSGVDAARVGLLGFSLGGYLCLCNRALVNVLVEFFAPVLNGIGVTANPTLHVQIHHGIEDEWVKLIPNAKPIEKTLRSESRDVALFRYKEAGHGFSGKYGGDVAAQIKSKRRALAFFEKRL